MRHQRVREAMLAQVGGGIRMRRRAKQRKAHYRAQDVVSVLAVVEQGDSVSCLAEIGPAVSAHLEAGLIPTGVGMRAPLHVAELNLVRRPRRSHRDRKRCLQKLVLLLPVDLGFDSKNSGAGVADYPLVELRRAELPCESDRP